MKFIVLIDKTDEASINIGKFLRENYPSISLYFLEKPSIYSENIDKKPELKDYSFFIFATKHKAIQENKTLTIHAPGNWNKANFGGKPGKICSSSAFFLKSLIIELNKINEQAKSSYQISMEVTHHGPYIEKPCCFIEIGSSEEEWKDKTAGEIIAETINNIIKNFQPFNFIPAIGIGGPHYAPNFNKIQINSNYALAHIIPEYVLITEEMIKQAIEKTIEKPEIVLLDWKGIGKSEERKKIIEILNKLGLRYERTSNIEK